MIDLVIDMSFIRALIGGIFLTIGGLIILSELTGFRNDQSLTFYIVAAMCIIAGIWFINSGFPFINFKVVP